ncbi:hypothetical protein [Streptomyces lunaelactis]|uniref:hypothetical protein n=1 Tax=Streptomyces lunaelactis TaxID=1535768 RepID=UPI001584CB7F|nr:hypothetical protein [Streptomyces lunaelactis]NUK00898.1 hypothetical protein [Streptomyces lunaelactis]NUK16506.1 hypothetical protein [Streptomyces lunaelactis]
MDFLHVRFECVAEVARVVRQVEAEAGGRLPERGEDAGIGHIKMIKRQMFGRAKLLLLRKRVL